MGKRCRHTCSRRRGRGGCAARTSFVTSSPVPAPIRAAYRATGPLRRGTTRPALFWCWTHAAGSSAATAPRAASPRPPHHRPPAVVAGGRAPAPCRRHLGPDGGHAGRDLRRPRLRGPALPTDDGAVAWWLFDRTDLVRAETAARETRRRADATSDLFSTLLSSLNVPRCAEVAARMAADHLAEAAVLITPPTGHRYAVTHALRGRRVVRETRQIDPLSVPGLDEALRGFPPVPARWINPAAIPDWVIPDGFTGPLGSVLVTRCPGTGSPPARWSCCGRTPRRGSRPRRRRSPGCSPHARAPPCRPPACTASRPPSPAPSCGSCCRRR